MEGGFGAGILKGMEGDRRSGSQPVHAVQRSPGGPVTDRRVSVYPAEKRWYRGHFALCMSYLVRRAFCFIGKYAL